MPFYSWQCLTICTDSYQIDLVIQDEQMMDMLLRLLIHETNSLNGERNSAQPLKAYLLNQVKSTNSTEPKTLLTAQIDQRVICRTLLVYKLNRIRQKICFQCLLTGKTISELVISRILISFKAIYPNHQDTVSKMIHTFKRTKVEKVQDMVGLLQTISSLQEKILKPTEQMLKRQSSL